MKEEKRWIVYVHTNKVNGKKYVGITCRSLRVRCGVNGKRYSSCPLFWNAICKYGWENFEHDVLYCNLTKDAACAMEISLIASLKLNDTRYGYNILKGGSANIGESLSRKIYQYSLNGELVCTYASVIAASIFLCGNSNRVSRLSDCANGKNYTAYGYVWSYKPLFAQEIIDKISKRDASVCVGRIKAGKKRGNKYGWDKIYQYSLDGILVCIHDSAQMASVVANIDVSSIYNCARFHTVRNCRIRLTAGGYVWSYCELSKNYLQEILNKIRNTKGIVINANQKHSVA